MAKAPEKLYIKDYKIKNSDGDEIQIVKSYESEPKWFSYIIFTKN